MHSSLKPAKCGVHHRDMFFYEDALSRGSQHAGCLQNDKTVLYLINIIYIGIRVHVHLFISNQYGGRVCNDDAFVLPVSEFIC